jgi:hypothetical protein
MTGTRIYPKAVWDSTPLREDQIAKTAPDDQDAGMTELPLPESRPSLTRVLPRVIAGAMLEEMPHFGRREVPHAQPQIHKVRFGAIVADMRQDPALNLHKTVKQLRRSGAKLAGMTDDNGKPLVCMVQGATVTVDGPCVLAEVVLEIPDGTPWSQLRERLNLPQ